MEAGTGAATGTTGDPPIAADPVVRRVDGSKYGSEQSDLRVHGNRETDYSN